MINQFRQRCFAMLMAVMMLFTMTPVQAFAEETHDHEHDAQVVEVIAEPVTVTAEEPVVEEPVVE